MEREIKFRGYSKEHGGWLFSHRIFTNTNDGENKGKTFLNITDYIDDWEEVEYLGEFTGIKDKNGKEIYEGDIVIFHQQAVGSLIEDDYTGIVKFQECCFTVDNEKKQESVPIFDEIGMWEVIGNIVEDEDLVNQIK